jgi:replicative DNA helicase
MADEIVRIESESGVIASLIQNPEFAFYSEHLLPAHFYDADNRYIYLAITELVKNGISNIDPYNIIEILSSSESTRRYAQELPIDRLHELVDMSDGIARRTVEEYKLAVDNVLDAAFRRDTLRKLSDCVRIVKDLESEDVQQQIYDALDSVMTEYVTANEVPVYSEVVDDCWHEIQVRQGTGYAGIPFKFPTLNEYVTIEPGELIIFGAEAKQGKSMLLLNCAVDLLRKGLSVLYLDSELNTRMFTARILAHLSGVEYKALTSGAYGTDDAEEIEKAREWLKKQRFTHAYFPSFRAQEIYTAVKRIQHTIGLDVLIIDYFKSGDAADAFESYQELGKVTNLVKNEICGSLNIAGIGAAQATAAGRLADSAKIARNASTIIMLQDKTEEEMERDGPECGNKKMRVVLNRNGMQHATGEYIDLVFQGNHILYEEARQHIPEIPF